MKNISNLTDFNFEISSGTVVVKVGLPSCGPCGVLQRNIESIESEYPDVKFLEINAEESEDIIDVLDIKNIPVLLLYKNGENIIKRTGIINIDELRTIIK